MVNFIFISTSSFVKKLFFVFSIIAIFVIHFMHPIFAFADIDTLTAASRISASGMHTQNERLKIIAQNLANMEVTAIKPEQDPYRRKIIFFKNEYNEIAQTETVAVDKVSHDMSQFIFKYEPSHPASDQNGYVKYPNVNLAIETVDLKEAQRSFEANLAAFEITKSNQNKLLELIK